MVGRRPHVRQKHCRPRADGGLREDHGDMDRFVANHTLRLDAQGRVAIPAQFRQVLARDGFEGLYCYPTLDRLAIDAGGNALLTEIEQLITQYPPYSVERESLSASLYGTSETLNVDTEGRVILTERLKS